MVIRVKIFVAHFVSVVSVVRVGREAVALEVDMPNVSLLFDDGPPPTLVTTEYTENLDEGKCNY